MCKKNYKDLKKEAMEKMKDGVKLSGKDNVLLPFIKDLLESMLETELELHLKEEKSDDTPIDNRKNGKMSKTMKCEQGEFELNTPRDRAGTFTPEIVEKQQTLLGDNFAESIISMYSTGTSYRDIQRQLKSLYGVSISKGKLTEITDRLIPKIDQWKNRSLDAVYPIIWLDAIVFSVREDNVTVKKAVHIVIGYNMEGQKQVLGMYLGDTESAKFWLSVLEDLQCRGVEDILISCMDNLSGFTQAVESVFPKTATQLCIIHQMRNSMKYVYEKQKKAVSSDLKKIYKAPNLESATIAMDEFEEKWKDKYPLIVKSWRNNWEHLTRFFDYSKEIRRIMYTTNTIEGFNRQIRKYTKSKGAFSSDKGLMKLVCTLAMGIESEWSSNKPNYWGLVQQQLVIKYGDRCQIKE